LVFVVLSKFLIKVGAKLPLLSSKLIYDACYYYAYLYTFIILLLQWWNNGPKYA